jgi:hypothetical protein
MYYIIMATQHSERCSSVKRSVVSPSGTTTQSNQQRDVQLKQTEPPMSPRCCDQPALLLSCCAPTLTVVILVGACLYCTIQTTDS